MTTIHTIGHSTRPIEGFIALLQAHGVTQLVDIRTVPRSRHNPQFAQDALAASLAEAGLGYHYLKQLGGLRSKVKDSTNLGWRNQSFRNYADHMQTDDFRQGIAALLEIAQRGQTAIMCAEAVPWRCHRSLVGDALLARGVSVLDIIGEAAPKPHKLTSFAVVDGQQVSYPGPTADQVDAEPADSPPQN
ncbi:MAG: DUF488 domain-containing protein [Brooklawnia sp.]|uniref:DUF488 domain-containing protein n=1 Tax=Brooklawnia sp. TaxID=2699740 RepID=UPI003C738C44